MEFEVLKKIYFKMYIIHWHGWMGFTVGEAKEVLYKKKTRAHPREILFLKKFNEILFGKEKMKTSNDKWMVKLEFIFQN